MVHVTHKGNIYNQKAPGKNFSPFSQGLLHLLMTYLI